MKKVLFAVVGSALIVTSLTQLASAGERGRHAKRATAAQQLSQTEANAYLRYQEQRSSYGGYYNGGGAISAPAGR